MSEKDDGQIAQVTGYRLDDSGGHHQEGGTLSSVAQTVDDERSELGRKS
jgi:hypothetical protein